jgi:uncharacterized protein (TIGR03437 family)
VAIFLAFLLGICGVAPLLSATDSGAKSYTIQTVAGSDFVGDNGPAVSAVFSQTEGIAVDRLGNIFVADADDNRIRKITPDGMIHTFAGTGAAGFAGDGGAATAAMLDHPYGIAVDLSGNLYVADLGNSRIRKITADGNIQTVAGGGATIPDTLGNGAAALSVKLVQPRNLAVDNDGTFYISDFGAHRVYRVSASGVLAGIAGTGKAGFAGDGAPALLALINSPAGLASDQNGSLYIADSGNNRIRKVNHGIISTFYSVSAPTGVALTAGNVLYVAGSGYVGTTTKAIGGIPSAQDLALDTAGNLYATVGQVVGKVGITGNVSTVAGSGASRYFAGENTPAISARFHNPSGLAVDAAGNWYVADTANNRIRKITPSGIVTTVAGTGVAGAAGDGGPALLSQLNSPRSVAIDSQHNLYIADTGNNRVRKITPAGNIVSVPLPPADPEYVATGPDGSLYIADTGNNRVLRVGPSGAINTAAAVVKPAAVTVDQAGNLYVSESARVSKVTPGGLLTTLLDGLNGSRGLAITTDGDLLIAQPGVHIVLRLSSSGTLTTIAGTGAPGFAGDGGPGNAAQLNSPSDVAVDSAGNVWVADSGNDRIRSLTAAAAAAITQNVTVVHSASLAAGPIAPGEIITIFGSKFELGQTQLLFDGRAATIFYTGVNQINALAPADLPVNTTTEVVIQVLGATVADFRCAVVSAAPGIFTTANGAGQAAATNQDGSINSSSNPVDRGSIIVLYATGGGSDLSAVTVNVGGYAADVLYAGPAPGFPGLMQVNARVPGGSAPSGILPVAITVGNASSQDGVTIAVR